MTVISKSIAIVVGSIRSPRVGPKVADLIYTSLQPALTPELDLNIVDLADFKLPIFDEAVIPVMVPEKATFSNAHSKDWSAAMSKYDAYIFLTPEYNSGIPGGLKNALDYLYHEIKGKPAVIVSYGGAGGDKASAALNTVFGSIGLKVAPTRPALAFQSGDNGPEIVGAMGSGELGPSSRVSWQKNGDILKAFGELREEMAGEQKAQ